MFHRGDTRYVPQYAHDMQLCSVCVLCCFELTLSLFLLSYGRGSTRWNDPSGWARERCSAQHGTIDFVWLLCTTDEDVAVQN
jgi:hypothetical protein